MTKRKYRELLLQKVIPAIQQKWPRGQWSRDNFIIRLQQDGVKAHISPDYQELHQGLEEMGLETKVLIYLQPANSPDLNVNDLGFFRALQALHYSKTSRNTEELISNVLLSYDEYEPGSLNKIWLSLMQCYNLILEHIGGNDYPLPHLKN